MWESRVLGEISKSLWKPFCGSIGTSFPQASSPSPDVLEAEIQGMLYPCRLADHRS
jgi:hypothetical protein